MAGETLLTVTDAEREWWRQESIFRNELDQQARMSEAREKIREKALKEGRKKGKEELIQSLREVGVPEDTIGAALRNLPQRA